MSKFKVVLGLSGVAITAYAAGKLAGLLRGTSVVVYPIPGKAFYIFSRIPWDGWHDEDINNLHATISGLYDSYEEYQEIEELNDIFYTDNEN